MNLTLWLGRLLGYENAVEIGGVEPSLSAPWAQAAPAWVVFGCLGAAALAVLFYTRFQFARRKKGRLVLAALRAAVLALVVLIFAEPVLTVRITSQMKPAVWLLFDGTDSMAIADELAPAERQLLARATGLGTAQGDSGSSGATAASPADANGGRGETGSSAASAGGSPAASRPSRIEYVKALVRRPEENLIAQLEKKFRLRAFLFDRADGARALETAADGRDIDPEVLAGQLTTAGQLTALGAALDDLARRQSTLPLAAVVVFSDFNQNAGPPALEAARRLGAPVYTVGVGPAAAVDLAVDLQCPPAMKKDERYPLLATLRQEGLAGRTVTLRVLRRQGPADSAGQWQTLESRQVALVEPSHTVELAFVPSEVGRCAFRAEVDPEPGEVIVQNNQADCETTVHDNIMRLLYVEYEPTWEWRFVKEVFHRDRLVGQKGFRTFLRSADPKVRQTNELFVSTLSAPRQEFFMHDVIILGDMPASALSPRFCQMTQEFVEKLGGGLVVVAGPRFGPGQLALTPLGDMLPVKVDPTLHLRDRKQPFVLRRTAEAAQYDFMQLDTPGPDNDRAWANLTGLTWYQPVERLHAVATALAEHPSDRCVDGKTPQPLIAIRPYGRGEVVYLGFNEMWRLRRGYGERYYRQFWGQLIHRLASRHALGAGKRFVVRTDRPQYQPNDQVLLTVEAFDENFKPLAEAALPQRKLNAELVPPADGAGGPSRPRNIALAMLREGVFEARFPVLAGGEHRVRVFDPVAKQHVETTFRVASVSVERQRAVRNTALQQALADATGGKSYDLATAGQLPDDIRLPPRLETNIEVIPLWNTWLVFGLASGLMLAEWLGRKWMNLP